MFAKLKKKIQEESGSNPDDISERSFGGHGPGLASPVTSPVRLEASPAPESIKPAPGLASRVGSIVRAALLGDGPGLERRGSVQADQADGDGPTDTPEKDIGSTKEEVLAMLLRRTEQVKKLEGKVTELAAMIKEKNRNIEKLEVELEKQQDATSKKIADLNEQYNANRARVSEGLSGSSRKQEDELRRELLNVIKEKQDLEKKLKDAEQYRDKYFKREEESDELQGLAAQELAKVKHMLLLKQEEFASLQQELADKSRVVESSERRQRELSREVDNLLQQISQMTTTNDKIEARNEVLNAKMLELNAKNQTLEDKCVDLEKQAAKSTKKLQALQHVYSELYNDHQILQRNSDLHRKKSKAVLEQKEEYLAHASERIITLEKRLKSGQMPGDDRVKALEAERDKLEKQLEETRQHLSEVKVTYSNHNNHLEAEIAHLNKKMLEEREERERSGRDSERMLQNLQLQREELLQRVVIAEKHEQDTMHIAVQMDKELMLQKAELEKRLSDERKDSSKAEEAFKKEVKELHEEISRMKKLQKDEMAEQQQKLAQLETSQTEALEREIDTEKRMSSLEEELRTCKKCLSEKEKEVEMTKRDLKDKARELEALLKNAQDTEGEVEKQRLRIEELQASLKALQTDYQSCSKEKDSLLVRNAQLSQELEGVRRQSRQEKEELQREMKARECAISGLEQSLQDHQREISDHLKKVEELEEKNIRAFKTFESTEVVRLKAALKESEDQLAEKNKTIRMQQQRLTDLKKTLQRELKVQTLPNDEPLSDSEAVRPLVSRNLSETRSHSALSLHNTDGPGRAYPVHTANGAPSKETDTTTVGSMGQSLLVHNAAKNNKKRLPFNAQGEYDHTQDINLEYLKHVLLKFMLSRESEAIHLIKAVSTLLNFTTDEQQLIKETLEYKSSWFGRMPASLGKGQTSKIIPPSY